MIFLRENCDNAKAAAITSEINFMRKDEKFSDLWLICTEQDRLNPIIIKVHQIVFSPLSPMLRQIFRDGQSNQPNPLMITLQNVDPIVAKKLVECIYEGKTMINDRQIKEMSMLCKMLQLKKRKTSFNNAREWDTETIFCEGNVKPAFHDWDFLGYYSISTNQYHTKHGRENNAQHNTKTEPCDIAEGSKSMVPKNAAKYIAIHSSQQNLEILGVNVDVNTAEPSSFSQKEEKSFSVSGKLLPRGLNKDPHCSNSHRACAPIDSLCNIKSYKNNAPEKHLNKPTIRYRGNLNKNSIRSMHTKDVSAATQKGLVGTKQSLYVAGSLHSDNVTDAQLCKAETNRNKCPKRALALSRHLESQVPTSCCKFLKAFDSKSSIAKTLIDSIEEMNQLNEKYKIKKITYCQKVHEDIRPYALTSCAVACP